MLFRCQKVIRDGFSNVGMGRAPIVVPISTIVGLLILCTL